MNCCVIVYHVIDNNVFETCLRTLRKVSDCEIVVFTEVFEACVRGMENIDDLEGYV